MSLHFLKSGRALKVSYPSGTPAGQLGTIADLKRVFFDEPADAWEALPWWVRLWRTLRGRRVDAKKLRESGQELVRLAAKVPTTMMSDRHCPPGQVFLIPEGTSWLEEIE